MTCSHPHPVKEDEDIVCRDCGEVMEPPDPTRAAAEQTASLGTPESRRGFGQALKRIKQKHDDDPPLDPIYDD